MKMEPIVSSETSAIKSQTPGNYPKRNKLHLQHGESLRTRIYGLFARFSFVLTVCALSFVYAFRHRVPSLSMFHVCRMRPLFSLYLGFSFTCALASVIVFPLAKLHFNTETVSYTLFRFLLYRVFRRKCVKLQDDITQVIF